MPKQAEQMARDLLAHIQTVHAAELALVNKRVAVALAYIEGIADPNQHAMEAVRKILTGKWDDVLDAAQYCYGKHHDSTQEG